MIGFYNRDKFIEDGNRLGIYNPDNKLALVVGSSRSWEKDIENFQIRFPDIPFDIIAINKAMISTENLKHWCSMHPTCYHDAKWDKIRLERGWENNYKTHAPSKPSGSGHNNLNRINWRQFINYVWNVYCHKGSSSLFGIGVAMGIGYKGVITCGVELLGPYRRYIVAFKNFNRAFPNFIKSQSGCLRAFVGYPTKEWIQKVMS